MTTEMPTVKMTWAAFVEAATALSQAGVTFQAETERSLVITFQNGGMWRISVTDEGATTANLVEITEGQG